MQEHEQVQKRVNILAQAHFKAFALLSSGPALVQTADLQLGNFATAGHRLCVPNFQLRGTFSRRLLAVTLSMCQWNRSTWQLLLSQKGRCHLVFICFHLLCHGLREDDSETEGERTLNLREDSLVRSKFALKAFCSTLGNMSPVSQES